MKLDKALLILFLSLITTVSFFGQKKTRKEYERERRALKQKIALANKVIDEIKSEEKSTLVELRAVNMQLVARERIIQTIQDEIDILKEEQEELSGVIIAMQEDTARLKKEYSDMVFAASRLYHNYNNVTYVFSGKTIDEISKRLEYLREFNKARHNQVLKINAVLASLNSQIEKLNKSREEKEKLKKELVQEKSGLDLAKLRQDNLMKKLKGRENEQKKEIKKWEKRQKELDAIIKKFIEDELRKQKEQEKNKTLEEKKKVELKSKDFYANKGKLPWPLDKCSVTRKFGRQKNALLDIYENNLGVGLLAETNASVKAVFDGKVAIVATIRGQNKMVMVKHGTYFTVYINLKGVTVRPGQEIKVGEQLGVVSANADGASELEFHVWKGNGANSQKLNPELWLVK